LAGVVEASYVFEDGKFSGAACEPILYPYLIFVFNYLFKTVLSDEFELASDCCGMQEPGLNTADATQQERRFDSA